MVTSVNSQPVVVASFAQYTTTVFCFYCQVLPLYGICWAEFILTVVATVTLSMAPFAFGGSSARGWHRARAI